MAGGLMRRVLAIAKFSLLCAKAACAQQRPEAGGEAQPGPHAADGAAAADARPGAQQGQGAPTPSP
jgi:hypothetical protein